MFHKKCPTNAKQSPKLFLLFSRPTFFSSAPCIPINLLFSRNPMEDPMYGNARRPTKHVGGVVGREPPTKMEVWVGGRSGRPQNDYL